MELTVALCPAYISFLKGFHYVSGLVGVVKVLPTYLFIGTQQILEVQHEVSSGALTSWLELVPVLHAYISRNNVRIIKTTIRALALLYFLGLVWQVHPSTSVSWTLPWLGGCYHWSSSSYLIQHWCIQFVGCQCWQFAGRNCGCCSCRLHLAWSVRL
jgi:hypothetical protein